MAGGEAGSRDATSVARLGQGTGASFLAELLFFMPDAAIAVDASGTIVSVNALTESLFGYAAHELEGKAIEVLLPERARHSHRRLRSGYVEKPRARTMGAGLELFGRRMDGSEFPVDVSLAPMGGGDQPLVVVAAVRDITERKAAQSAQAKLAAIVESSVDGIFSMSSECVVTSWNGAALSMFGYTPQEVVGHHFSEFFPDDHVLEELLDAARSGCPSASTDTSWPTRGGGCLDVALSVSPLGALGADGFSVLVRDITTRKKAEAQLVRHARWLSAAAEIRLRLLSGAPLEEPLELVCKWAVELSSASAAALVLADEDNPRILASSGAEGALAAVRERLDVLLKLPETEWLALGPGLTATAFPIVAHVHGPSPVDIASSNGALVTVATTGEAEGLGADEIVSSLATQAVLAVEAASLRAQRERALISADRERIARDLHDLVIQRLFGAGLRLQGIIPLLGSSALAAKLATTVDDLDSTIKEIREAIFALESAPGIGLRAKVVEAVADAGEHLGFRPKLAFHGSVDADIALSLQLEAMAVLREALSNCARHADASRVDVAVTVGDDLSVLVVDDGMGIGEPSRFSGIANSRARAALLGGSLEVGAAPGGGTRFEWRVPVRL